MKFDVYNETMEYKLNVEILESFSIENGNVGIVLKVIWILWGLQERKWNIT